MTQLFSDFYYIRRSSSWFKGCANSVKNDNVLERFHDTMCFENFRYEISLLWITDWKHLANNYKIVETQLVCLVNRMRCYIEPYYKILFEYLNMNISDVVPSTEKPSYKQVFYSSRYKG